MSIITFFHVFVLYLAIFSHTHIYFDEYPIDNPNCKCIVGDFVCYNQFIGTVLPGKSCCWFRMDVEEILLTVSRHL